MTQGPAIVVGRTDYGERDRIVRLLSPHHGRVSALARNARGSKRRFAGALGTGARIDAHLRAGRGTLWHLDRAELLDGHLGVRNDLDRLGLLAYACELCGALAREHHAEPRLYGLLELALVLLDAMTAPPGEAWRIGLETKALTFAGLAPILDRCRVCGAPPEEPMRFDPASGGAAHTHCEGSGGRRAPVDWLAAAELARRTSLRELIDTPMPPGPTWAVAEAVEAHLGRALQSRGVLRSLSSG